MAGSLMPYTGGFMSKAEERRTSRALAAIDQQRQFDLVVIEAKAEVEAAKVDAITYVAKVAMQDVTILSQLEAQLADVVPLAVSRLQAIGDIAALAMAEVVTNTARRLR
jgi:hypothetical protein